MSKDWKAELEKLKQLPTEEIGKMQKKERDLRDAHTPELKNLMELVKSQLEPVVEVFRVNDGRAENEQPHISEDKNGYMLTLPIIKRGDTPKHLRVKFEFHLTEEGYILKVEKESFPEKILAGPERTIEAPITEEKIRNEVRAMLRERQHILLEMEKNDIKLQRKIR